MKGATILTLGCAAMMLSTQAHAQTRTTTTTTTTRTIQPAPTSPPTMIIPGGAGDILNTPLWFRATKLICEVQTNDGSPSDEAYVVLATVMLNWEKLWESKVLVWSTSVYDDMNNQDFRSIARSVWDTDAIPVRAPTDVIIAVAVYEHDNGNVFFSTEMLRAALFAKIGTLHPGYTYPQIAAMIDEVMSQSLLHTVQREGGDDPLHPSIVQLLPLTAQELSSARSGEVVKKSLPFYDTFGGGTVGKYVVRFQLSKQGVAPVAW